MKRLFYIIIFILSLSDSYSKDSLAIINYGKNLFNTNCVSCHGIGKEKMGPSLASIPKKRSKEWLHRFIRNSQEVILSGDPYAVRLFEQYNRNVMPRFRFFSSEDIDAILSYIEYRSLKPDQVEIKLIDGHKYNGMDGQILFQDHCKNCHSIDHEGYGPALASITKRRPKEWLVPFIKNSAKVIDSGDPYANFLYNSFHKRRMNSFGYLDSNSINAILKYIEYSSVSPNYMAGVNGIPASKNNQSNYFRTESELQEESKKHYGLFFKIVLIIFASFAACIHGLFIYKLYKYLVNNE